jgi:hypothetical protein
MFAGRHSQYEVCAQIRTGPLVARLSLCERRVDLADIALAPVTIFTDSWTVSYRLGAPHFSVSPAWIMRIAPIYTEARGKVT